MWSEPSQVEYLQKHCQASIKDPAQAIMIVLRLLSVRVKFLQRRFTAKQAQSSALDCLVRIWAVIDSWKLLVPLRSSYLDVVVPYFQSLRALFAGICTKGYRTVLAFKVATLLSRSVAGLLQLCLTESYPSLEHVLCSSLIDLLRRSRASEIIVNATDEHILPVLQGLIGNQVQIQRLGHELQVNTPDSKVYAPC